MRSATRDDRSAGGEYPGAFVARAGMRLFAALVLGMVVLAGVASAQTPTECGCSTSADPQEQTRDCMQAVGVAWLSWLTDQVSSPHDSDPTRYYASAERSRIRSPSVGWGETLAPWLGPRDAHAGSMCAAANAYDLSLTHEQLVADLIPSEFFFYISCVPEVDGWGLPFEFRRASNVLVADVLWIRSRGADAEVEVDDESQYTQGTFPSTMCAGDLVWQDGFFCRHPAGPPSCGCGQPLVGCTAAPDGAASLVIKDRAPGTQDKLRLKWRGDVAHADFGDPTADTSYFACIHYGDSKRQWFDIPAEDMSCGSRPCWKAKSNENGYQYGNTTGSHGGLRKVTLKPGSGGKGRIDVTRRNGSIDIEAGNIPPGLPLRGGAPITVQISRRDAANCWEASFSPPFKKNEGQLRAR